jgi:mycothiol synthase
MLGPDVAVPVGYAAAPAIPADLPEIAALMGEADRALYGDTTLGEAFLAGEWARPRFDPATDTLILRDDAGTLVGYADAFDEDTPAVLEGFATVHPGHLGRGLGVLLVAAREGRAAAQATRLGGPVRLRSAVYALDHGARELLAARGYGRVRSFFHMEVDLSEPIAADQNPEGVTVRGFVSGEDDRAAHGTIEAAFAGTWGFHPLTYEEFDERIVGREFEPDLSLMAHHGEAPVGTLLGGVMDDVGWVDMLAVLPEWRGRGIGAGLLSASFVRFRERGLPRALLNVDSENEAGAVRLYERVGMRVRRQWDLYEKEIRGSA